MDGKTLEAGVEKAEVEPNIGMDAFSYGEETSRVEKQNGEMKKEDSGSFTGTAGGRFNRALQLFEGKYIPQDKNRAVALLRQGMEEGHAPGCSACT
jgi:TPR repeat protein